jgi:hypothetical protein
MLGERAVERQWIQHEHYWILSYRLRWPNTAAGHARSAS